MNRYHSAMESTADGEDSLEEVAAFFEANLSRQLPPETIHELFKSQVDFRRKQQFLGNQLDGDKISAERYLSELNMAMKLFMADSFNILGKEDFFRVYGEVGEQPESLIDRDRFLAAHPSI